MTAKANRGTPLVTSVRHIERVARKAARTTAEKVARDVAREVAADAVYEANTTVMNVKQAADFLDIAVQTMRSWRMPSRSKGPPWHKTDTGSVFYLRHELIKYVQDSPQPDNRTK